MTLETYLLFVGASFLLVLSPGPDMVYLLSRSIAQGSRAGMVAALGINAGAYVHVVAAVTGLSALLMTSALAFTAVKWTGAAYLVFLGVRALRASEGNLFIGEQRLGGSGLRAVFWQGFASCALNPKVAVFFLALLPQFVDLHASNAVNQLLLLGVTANVIAILVNLVLAAAAGRISARLRQSPAVGRWLHRAMGAMFILLGIRLATERA